LKQHLKLVYKQTRLWLSANNSVLLYIFYTYFYTPKKGSLSDFLNAYSKASPHKIKIVQVGANDGITHDPVHKFIKRDKWQGVLLEPQKNVFPTLSYIYSKNKEIVTVNAALALQDGVGTIYKIGFSEARWASGLTSFNKTTLESAFSSGYVAQKAKEEGVIIPEEDSKRIVEEQIQLIAPSTLITRYQLQHIDILQIDTEGYDFEIIKMFNIEQTKPQLIVFESKHFGADDKKQCMDYLAHNHYQVKDFGANSIALIGTDNRFKDFFHASNV
jgi:FkbM family methyltransferase